MKKVIRLSESDLARIVKRVLKEQQSAPPVDSSLAGSPSYQNQTKSVTPNRTTEPTRKYQVSDFVTSTFAVGAKIPFETFTSDNYRKYMRSLGLTNQQLFDYYDKRLQQGEGFKPQAKSELCAVLQNNIVLPSIKNDATQDVKDFMYSPVKIVCDGYYNGIDGRKISNVVVKPINSNDATNIAKFQKNKKFTTDASYLIVNS
jgi:hypothetical protein